MHLKENGVRKKAEFRGELPMASVKCLWNKSVCVLLFMTERERGKHRVEKRAIFESGEELFYIWPEKINMYLL